MQPHVWRRALVAIAAVVGQATAQQPGATQQPVTSSPAYRSVADGCVDLMNGRVPPGEDVAALRAQCEALLRTGAGPRDAGVQAGVATAAPTPGPSAPTAFTQPPAELTGRGRGGLGATMRGRVRNTLVTDPLGWFSGIGVNAAYMRPFPWEHASWIASARYSRTNATNGHVTSFGLGTGADLFLYGRNNEGIRLGPRLDFSFGREEFDTSTDFARLGAAAELGYNFIASNGISAAVMGGYGARLAGDAQDENFTSYTGGEDGPYLKLGLGYSW